MVRYAVLVFLAILLGSCKKFDKQYFLSNPEVLQQTVKECNPSKLFNINCSQLEELSLEMNSLVYDLQINPQAFGIKILKLQENLAEQESLLAKNPPKKDSKQSLEALSHQLKMRLAVVRWLESPES